jgi:hypothetical protein
LGIHLKRHVPNKKTPGEGNNPQSTDASITCPNPDLFDGKRLAPTVESDHGAVEHLKSGAELRLRAHREAHDRKVGILRACAREFESALIVYCRCETAVARMGAEIDPTDLIIELTKRPWLDDLDELEDAVERLREACSDSLRRERPGTWIVDMNTLGCTLTLLGKAERATGDISRLEEAIGTFHEVLREPALVDMPRQRVIVHINLADALCALGDATLGDRQVEYFESAVDELAKAMALVVPEGLRHFAEADPKAFV